MIVIVFINQVWFEIQIAHKIGMNVLFPSWEQGFFFK